MPISEHYKYCRLTLNFLYALLYDIYYAIISTAFFKFNKIVKINKWFVQCMGVARGASGAMHPSPQSILDKNKNLGNYDEHLPLCDCFLAGLEYAIFVYGKSLCLNGLSRSNTCREGI